MKDTFQYDRRTGIATVMLRGQLIEIRAPEARAHKMYEFLASGLDDRGLLYSPPHNGTPSARSVRF